ncbi:MAG: polysaccharide biosynthesis protein [Clostridia bacterium]|nr:polysaccharide biosynthesis protein [Clostridia bacterium]
MKNNKGKSRSLQRTVILLVLDALFICISYFGALLLRFDFSIGNLVKLYPEYLNGFLWSMPYWIISTWVVFYCFRLYQGILQFASVADLVQIIEAYAVLIPVYLLGIWFMQLRMPRSYILGGFFISFMATCAIRFAYRLIRFAFQSRQAKKNDLGDVVMIIGAGEAGRLLVRELNGSDKVNAKVACIIDDNPAKRGHFLEGVPIVGGRDEIALAAKKYSVTRIILAIPTIRNKDRREILDCCQKTTCKLQIIPGVYQLVDGSTTPGKMRDVDVTDLLGREEIHVKTDEILSDIKGKVILVTGGGGSIGSELCRQIARSGPKQLIILEIYENSAYAIQQELKRSMPDLNLTVLIGSVRNTSRVRYVMETYKPDVVFHAAAHKHVPLMEDSPNEAIKNNVLGTYKTAVAAASAGVGKFVLISTDKAVNPTNIMGASKRLCEMVVQMMDRRSPGTSFVAVRFGNVLGSNGSVIPLFKEQIAAGGPVTVTDKRIIRYFMTIPEAVALVLQASYYASGGEIFVLDMGEPVSIDEMARNLIRLSGYRPDIDIKIVYTGLRPGEKLYEELLMDEEGMKETANKLIHIGKPIEMDDAAFQKSLMELDEASRSESDRIRQIVSEIVPTYHYKKEESKQ